MSGPARAPSICSVCGAPAPESSRAPCRRRRLDCAGVHTTRPRAVHPTLRYEDDAECQRLVAEHPGGMTLEEVGAAMGVTRERIRQIEERALKRLVMRLRLVGIEVDALRDRSGT